uniref:Uncharacterized protein n=1 Tax=Romanomermis culicivorax TaxID=13658 RepID=A0A915K9P0_ROMCU
MPADPLIFGKNNPTATETSTTSSQKSDSENPKIEKPPPPPPPKSSTVDDAKRRALLHYQKSKYVDAVAENAKYFKMRTKRGRILTT